MNSKLIIYPEFDARVERDYMYSVSVTQGERTASLPVYSHTENSSVARNPIDDHRSDEYRRFSTFAFCGNGVRVDIKVNKDFNDYAILPSAKKIKHEFKDGVISVFLDRPEYFVVRLDSKDHTILSILADEPESNVPIVNENTIVVDKWQEVDGGVLTVTEPDTTIYIPAGCVLNARVMILADNCKIVGRGAIIDPVGDIYRYNASEISAPAVLFVKAANNTIIDGIHILDSKAYNVEFIGIWGEQWALNNRISHVKILSTQLSSDGITFCYYTRDSYAEHCFVYVGDNALVYEEYAHYKDITIGTTCNAVYPQTDVVDSSVEDVYIFRADEGIINSVYKGEDGVTKIENHIIKNLNAVDVTFTPYFFFVEIPNTHPVVTNKNGLMLENIYLANLPDTKTNTFYSYNRTSVDGYPVTVKNLCIGGALIREITTETVGGRIHCRDGFIKCVTDNTFEVEMLKSKHDVYYKNPINVFVGKYQVYFEYPIRKDENGILLPLVQLKGELRAKECEIKPEIFFETEYIYACDVARSGMAKAIEIYDNNIIITPNYNFENLILSDTGIISKFTEVCCYACHLIVINEDDIIYRIINTRNHVTVGVFRSLSEEIKKYGEGEYQLDFSVRTKKQEVIKAGIDYSLYEPIFELIQVFPEWREYSLKIKVDKDHLEDPRISMMIYGNGETPFEVIDIKNICLRKII